MPMHYHPPPHRSTTGAILAGVGREEKRCSGRNSERKRRGLVTSHCMMPQVTTRRWSVMSQERFQKHRSLHWPNESLALDHAPNEIHGA